MAYCHAFSGHVANVTRSPTLSFLYFFLLLLVAMSIKLTTQMDWMYKGYGSYSKYVTAEPRPARTVRLPLTGAALSQNTIGTIPTTLSGPKRRSCRRRLLVRDRWVRSPSSTRR